MSMRRDGRRVWVKFNHKEKTEFVGNLYTVLLPYSGEFNSVPNGTLLLFRKKGALDTWVLLEMWGKDMDTIWKILFVVNGWVFEWTLWVLHSNPNIWHQVFRECF
jgi:hypothetical protein